MRKVAANRTNLRQTEATPAPVTNASAELRTSLFRIDESVYEEPEARKQEGFVDRSYRRDNRLAAAAAGGTCNKLGMPQQARPRRFRKRSRLPRKQRLRAAATEFWFSLSFNQRQAIFGLPARRLHRPRTKQLHRFHRRWNSEDSDWARSAKSAPVSSASRVRTGCRAR